MDSDLFEYEMKKKGYRTPEMRAAALGISLSAYYRRVGNVVECTRSEINEVASILGWEAAKAIFFDNKVS